jgi:serine/threonine-protein kinase
MNQNPRPPAQVNKGSTIDLVVSKGNGPHKISLPDFRGSMMATVTTQLDSLKLKVGNVSDAPSDKYPPGTIISQNPGPGAEVPEGSTIDFNVAKSSTGGTKRATVSIVIPDGPPHQAVQIVVNDANGRRVVYEATGKPGDKIDRAIEGVGQVKVQVYINGVLVQEQTL